ncbi:hypothetical protein ACFE04_019344 [Oxalis oulophora]
MRLMVLIMNDLLSINRDKYIKIVIVHDIVNAIACDITPSDGMSKEEKSRREREALHHMCKLLGEEGQRAPKGLFPPEPKHYRGPKLKVAIIGARAVLVKREPNVSYICSRYYCAPELIFGATEYTTAIDIWFTGCVMAELLLGQPLFPGESGRFLLDSPVVVFCVSSVLSNFKVSFLIALCCLHSDFRVDNKICCSLLLIGTSLICLVNGRLVNECKKVYDIGGDGTQRGTSIISEVGGGLTTPLASLWPATHGEYYFISLILRGYGGRVKAISNGGHFVLELDFKSSTGPLPSHSKFIWEQQVIPQSPTIRSSFGNNKEFLNRQLLEVHLGTSRMGYNGRCAAYLAMTKFKEALKDLQQDSRCVAM